MSPWNELAYTHYLECKAVGSFPDDPIVRRNASLIRSVEDAVADGLTKEFLETCLMMGVG